MKDDEHKGLSSYDRWPRKRGQTIIDLVVLMLIFTILAVTLLPTMKPFLVEAWYDAHAMFHHEEHEEHEVIWEERIPSSWSS